MVCSGGERERERQVDGGSVVGIGAAEVVVVVVGGGNWERERKLGK